VAAVAAALALLDNAAMAGAAVAAAVVGAAVAAADEVIFPWRRSTAGDAGLEAKTIIVSTRLRGVPAGAMASCSFSASASSRALREAFNFNNTHQCCSR
jgi:hypothetical protein